MKNTWHARTLNEENLARESPNEETLARENPNEETLVRENPNEETLAWDRVPERSRSFGFDRPASRRDGQTRRTENVAELFCIFCVLL